MLNAKHHENEAFVVAQAGKLGSITVSTNMAGRGTDIMLGGNPEMLARWDFKQAGRDPDLEPAEFEQLVEQFEETCAKEHDEVVELGGRTTSDVRPAARHKDDCRGCQNRSCRPFRSSEWSGFPSES